MPKIIDNAKEHILEEAKRQLFRDGYAGMTLRSVARGCGIAVGTIYNYFSSKDMLVASFMLEDWTQSLTRMREVCARAERPTDAFRGIYDELVSYSERYAALFCDTEARRSADDIFTTRHAMLRTQIAACIGDICRQYANRCTDHLPEFIAEAILAHASDKREFSELSDIIIQLFKNSEQE